MNALAPVSDKFDPLIGPVSTDRCGEVLAGPRFERTIEHLHRLGPRAGTELLIEIAIATGQPALIAGHIEEYSRLDPAVLRALGGDSFAPMPLGLVR